MINKLIGFGLVCISTILYLGQYMIVAASAGAFKGAANAYKMKIAVREIGHEPRVLAFTALLFGIIYIVRGEIREYIDRKEQSEPPA
ncbi:MAG: hypothetical protein ACYSWO_07785 [Planctomycetota bacterium]|jgi:hypothetical protein